MKEVYRYWYSVGTPDRERSCMHAQLRIDRSELSRTKLLLLVVAAKVHGSIDESQQRYTLRGTSGTSGTSGTKVDNLDELQPQSNFQSFSLSLNLSLPSSCHQHACLRNM